MKDRLRMVIWIHERLTSLMHTALIKHDHRTWTADGNRCRHVPIITHPLDQYHLLGPSWPSYSTPHGGIAAVLDLTVLPHADPTTRFANVTVLCQVPVHASCSSALIEQQWLWSRLWIPQKFHGQANSSPSQQNERTMHVQRHGLRILNSMLIQMVIRSYSASKI